jgi:hypothetical protein
MIMNTFKMRGIRKLSGLMKLSFSDLIEPLKAPTSKKPETAPFNENTDRIYAYAKFLPSALTIVGLFYFLFKII